MLEKSENQNSSLVVHVFSDSWEFIGQVTGDDIENLFACGVINLKKPARVRYNPQGQMILLNMVNARELKGALRIRVTAYIPLNELGNVHKIWQECVSPIARATGRDVANLKNHRRKHGR